MTKTVAKENLMAKRWWWVRHAPVTCFDGKIYGQLDLPCDCSDDSLFDRAIDRLPEHALWVVTPLVRTAQTRDALLAAAQRRGLRRDIAAQHTEALFVEQHLGSWQSCSRTEIDRQRGLPRHPHWLAAPEERPPHGESFLDLVERVADAVTALQQAPTPDDIVVVAHAGTMRAALMHALALNAQTALKITIANCSVVCLEIKCESANCAGQLHL